MSIKGMIPTPTAIGREAITVLAGVLIAAWVLSRFPAVRNFVSGQSITVRDSSGNVLF